MERIPAEDLQMAIEDQSFSYDGYQVVRGEFFAHILEPSITFHRHKIYVNMACLNRLPSVEYVQILVNQKTKKLAVRPCREDEKDSFLWRTGSSGKYKPRQITCRLFYAKLAELMGWNASYRYKLLGKLIQSGAESLYLFDLMATEIYQSVANETGRPSAVRTPVFPAEWQHQFGLPVEEHRKQLQINIFNGYTVFGIRDRVDEEQAGGGSMQ